MSRATLFTRLIRQTLWPAGPRGPGGTRARLARALFVAVFLPVQVAHWVGFLLDDLLFPGYRSIRVREPVFVVGMPRSGTSFLQRVLAEDADRFTTPTLWELLLAPSITERKLWRALGRLDAALGRPLTRLLRAAERLAFRWMDDVHPVSLDAPEEDYFALLPVFACFLLVVPFPDSAAVWRLTRFDELDAAEREPILAFYEAFLQRHLYVHGADRRVLSKNPSFSPMIRSLGERFPDARVIFTVRNPKVALPSLLSSLRDGAAFFGWDVGEPPRRDRFIGMLRSYTEHAIATLPAWPVDRYAFITMEALKRDVRASVLDVYERFGFEAAPVYRAFLEAEAERGRAYRSGHAYSLAEFGLEAADVERDFAQVLEYFDFGLRRETVNS